MTDESIDADEEAPALQYMDLREFLDGGFLQEANRQFFHPLGLAMEVLQHDDGTVTMGGIWDYREDPEGMAFGGDYDLSKPEHKAKALNVHEEYERHAEARRHLFGNEIQPLG